MLKNSTNHGHIALGKANCGLKKFGEYVKANIFTEWDYIFKEYSNWDFSPNKFFGVVREIKKINGKIYFNITGVAIEMAVKGDIKCEEPCITEWELSTILRDKELYECTVFFRQVGDMFAELSTEDIIKMNLVFIE